MHTDKNNWGVDKWYRPQAVELADDDPYGLVTTKAQVYLKSAGIKSAIVSFGTGWKRRRLEVPSTENMAMVRLLLMARGIRLVDEHNASGKS